MVIDLIKSLGVAVVYLINFDTVEEVLKKQEDAEHFTEPDEVEYKEAA